MLGDINCGWFGCKSQKQNSVFDKFAYGDGWNNGKPSGKNYGTDRHMPNRFEDFTDFDDENYYYSAQEYNDYFDDDNYYYSTKDHDDN